MTIEERYLQACKEPSDINSLLPLIRNYCVNCERIVELGFRYGISTWALLEAKPKEIISYDILDFTKESQEHLDLATKEGIKFSFVIGDSLVVHIPECDVLLIDTLHTYGQCICELSKHHKKVKRFIMLHDTVTFGYIGQTSGDFGLKKAIYEFLANNVDWDINRIDNSCNGLMILEKRH